jgi:hypothetical protein
MQLQTVTDLVNSLFTYYDCNLQKLDWDNKINEYVDVINDLISYDTDLDELYKKIRQDYKYRKLPTPYDIKKIISKTKTISEIKEYVSHPDNNKLVLVLCYKQGELVNIRQYVMSNTPETHRTLSYESKKMREIYDDVKIRILPQDTTLIGRKLFIPEEYNSEGEVIKQRIEEVA